MGSYVGASGLDYTGMFDLPAPGCIFTCQTTEQCWTVGLVVKQARSYSLLAGLERMERLGFGAIRPGAGMAAMAALLRSGSQPALQAAGGMLPPSVVASVFFWDKLKSNSPLFAELKQLPHSGPESTADSADGATATAATTASTASPAAAGLTADALQAAVTAAVVAVLGSDPGMDAPLVGAGLDSLGETSNAAAVATHCLCMHSGCSRQPCCVPCRLLYLFYLDVLHCRRCGAAQ